MDLLFSYNPPIVSPKWVTRNDYITSYSRLFFVVMALKYSRTAEPKKDYAQD